MGSGTTTGGADSDFPLAADAARERSQLRASEARVAGEVVEFQLARQRAELVMPEIVEPLSPREREVAELLAVGRTDGEIADALFISKKTASVHVANIKGKLGASSRVEIALIAERLGLVEGASDGAGDGASATAWAVARAGRPVDLCPFKGLAPFEASDARFFFGRERLVADLVARMVGVPCLAVVGPSGSGKSSAVRAGLLPAVAGGVLPGSEAWPRALLRPGAAPMAALRRTLHDVAASRGIAVPDDATIAELRDRLTAASRLIVTVDQFEETFTLCPVEAERTAFIDALVALADDPEARSMVVLVIRADFYGRCAAYPGLARLLGEGTILVGPPSGQEIERAIEGPAHAAGLRVEAALTADLARDVVGEPGALPLLSTTLLDLWTRREGRVLRAATYRQIGGVSGAVARLAEAAFGRLNEEQQDVARGVLLRLAATGAGEVVVRRPVPLAEFDAERDGNVGKVLAVLADARLITISDGAVEVAHEALLRDWPRFSDWLESDREGRRLHDHLMHAAREWQGSGEDAGELIRGARLAATLEWAGGHDVELNTLERRFLAASRTDAEREIVRERRLNRRLRWLLTGAVGLLIVALVTSSFALVQLDRAESEAARAASEARRATDEARRAEAAATVARSRELTAASVATLDADPALSKLLAVAAADLAPPDAGLETALRRALAADPTIHRATIPDDLAIGRLVTDLHPDGERLVASSAFGTKGRVVAAIDLGTDAVAWRYTVDEAFEVGPAMFTDDGRSVVAAVSWHVDSTDGLARPPNTLGVIVLDARDGQVIKHVDTGPCGANLVAASETAVIIDVIVGSDGSPCWLASDDDIVLQTQTLDLASGRPALLVTDTYLDGALSRDGRYAAISDTANDDDRAIVVDLATGDRVASLDPTGFRQDDRYVRALSPDGSLLLYGDRPMMVIDVATGRPVATLEGFAGSSAGAAFGPAGTIVYTSGVDGTLRAWDAATGDLLFEAPAVGGGRPSATADGRVLVGDFTEKTVTLLDPAHRREVAASVETCPGFVGAGQLQIAGNLAAFTVECTNSTWRTYEIDPKRPQIVTEILNPHGQDIAVSPDGSRVAMQTRVGTTIGTIWVHDARTGQPMVELDGMCSVDATLPPASGPCKLLPEIPFSGWPAVVEYSPDARFLAVVVGPCRCSFGGIAVWDAMTGALLTVGEGLGVDVVSAIFTPDSKELLVTLRSGEIVGISTETWQVTRRAPLDPSIDDAGTTAFYGFTPDSTLIAGSGHSSDGGGSLLWIGLDDLQLRRPPVRSHDGSPKAGRLSPDGTMIATGAFDGAVKVWDAASGELLHAWRVAGGAQGVAFDGNDRLAVTPVGGDLLIFDLDRDKIVQAARASLTRPFIPEECQRFGFGGHCPTLDELRGSSTENGG